MSTEQTRQITKGKYRPEIDGLRAFAVIAVIINHFNKDILPGGYLGVDIFFVISGYVITLSLASKKRTDLAEFIQGFYTRRIKRILPALLLYVVPMSLLICTVAPNPKTELATGMSSLMGLSNIFLYLRSFDYFGTAATLNPFTQTWSLGVEEQFYFVYPFLIWFSGFGGENARKGNRVLIWTMVTASIISICIFLNQINANVASAYFMAPSRFWEIGVGCITYLLWEGRECKSYKSVLSALSILSIAIVMFFSKEFDAISVIVVVAATLVLIQFLKGENGIPSLFLNPIVVFTGKISYSLYLWHWGVLAISRWTLGVHVWTVPFQILIMLLISYASWKFVESPLRQSTWRIGFLDVFGISFSLAAFSMVGIASLGKFFDRYLFVGNALRDESIYGEHQKWNMKECQKYRLDSRVFMESVLDKCYIQSEGESARANTANLFAYGNSYNTQLTPLYARLLEMGEIKNAHAFSVRGCTASLHMGLGSGENKREFCRDSFATYLNYFEDHSIPGDILVIANSWDFFSDKLNSFELSWDGKSVSPQQALILYEQELILLGERLNKVGKRLVVTSPISVLKALPEICSQWFATHNNVCFAIEDVEKNKLLVHSSFEVGDTSSFVYIDLMSATKALAEESKSEVFEYYYNARHLSRQGSIKMTKVFLETI